MFNNISRHPFIIYSSELFRPLAQAKWNTEGGGGWGTLEWHFVRLKSIRTRIERTVNNLHIIFEWCSVFDWRSTLHFLNIWRISRLAQCLSTHPPRRSHYSILAVNFANFQWLFKSNAISIKWYGTRTFECYFGCQIELSFRCRCCWRAAYRWLEDVHHILSCRQHA